MGHFPTVGASSEGSVAVVCVLRSGGDFYAKDVLNLYRGVNAWCRSSRYGGFYCITDAGVTVEQEAEREKCLEEITILKRRKLRHKWWSKLSMFNEFVNTPAVYFDLDTYICRDVSGLLEAAYALSSDEFLMLTPFRNKISRKMRWLSGIMAWNGDFRYIEKEFKSEKHETVFGDQRWIAAALRSREVVVSSVNSHISVVSYKRHIEESGIIPEHADVVCFHGRPRPRKVGRPYWE